MLGLASQNILSFSYTDNTSDKADDLCVEVADPQRTWMTRFIPGDVKKGIECTASIRIEDWRAPMDTRPFECGIFFINSVHFAGPPNKVSIKASSIPPNGVKGTKKFKSWENTDLQGIAGEIAQANGLALFYDTQQNPRVKRTDQAEKSDLEYIRDRCKEAKLSMKIHKKQLVVYSEEEYEARPARFTFRYGASNILEFEFNTKNDDCYKSCTNCFTNPDTGAVTETKFTDEDIEGTDAELWCNEGIEYEPDDDSMRNRMLVPLEEFSTISNFRDDDPSNNKGKGKGGRKNSGRKAKAKLREKNKKEHQCKIKTVGNIDLLSGLNVQTEGFGIFDKKWFIESSHHEIASGGYTTDLSLRGTLKGY
jgi:phage protein D